MVSWGEIPRGGEERTLKPGPKVRADAYREDRERHPPLKVVTVAPTVSPIETVTPRLRFRRGRRRAGYLKGAAGLLLDPCAYCGGPGEVFDHIEPMARGGRNRLDNLTRACRDCNAHKAAKRLLVFLATR